MSPNPPRTRDAAWRERVRQYFQPDLPLWQAPTVEGVGFGAARSVVARDALARRLGLQHRSAGDIGRAAVLAAEVKAVG